MLSLPFGVDKVLLAEPEEEALELIDCLLTNLLRMPCKASSSTGHLCRMNSKRPRRFSRVQRLLQK